MGKKYWALSEDTTRLTSGNGHVQEMLRDPTFNAGQRFLYGDDLREAVQPNIGLCHMVPISEEAGSSVAPHSIFVL